MFTHGFNEATFQITHLQLLAERRRVLSGLALFPQNGNYIKTPRVLQTQVQAPETPATKSLPVPHRSVHSRPYSIAHTLRQRWRWYGTASADWRYSAVCSRHSMSPAADNAAGRPTETESTECTNSLTDRRRAAPWRTSHWPARSKPECCPCRASSAPTPSASVP